MVIVDFIISILTIVIVIIIGTDTRPGLIK